MGTKTRQFQDNKHEIENSDSDYEIDIDGKLRLDDADEEGEGYNYDEDGHGGSDEESDYVISGLKRKKGNMQSQPPTKKAKKTERKSKEIFVKNLPLGCSEDDIRKDFGDYDIVITKIKLRGRANGKTALITTFREMSESDVLSLDGMVVKDCPVIIELAKDKSKLQKGKLKKSKERNKVQANKSKESDSIEYFKKLFVKNLNWDVTEDRLREHFDCREIHLPKNADGTIRGFAYLTFTSEEAANEAFEDLQDLKINGRIIKLDRVAVKATSAKAPNNRNRHDGSKKGLLACRGRAGNRGKGRPKVRSSN